jgi:hypothetical protein
MLTPKAALRAGIIRSHPLVLSAVNRNWKPVDQKIEQLEHSLEMVNYGKTKDK